MTQHLLALVVVSCALAAACVAAEPAFQTHGTYVGVGACLKQLVAPGPTAGSERIYASHIYGGDTLDIIAIDPQTGHADVFSSPVPGEIGAWAMAAGPDGTVYIGTLPTAHVLKLDWAQRKLVDMGRPSSTESYIWQLALGRDGKLYGCTYPGAKLVRYDPATGKGEDLGRLDPVEQYARTVAADARGFVYVGLGPAARHIAAYEIATGVHKDVLPADNRGQGWGSVHLGDDGSVYAAAGDARYRLDGWNAVKVAAPEVRPEAALRLKDGRTMQYGEGKLTLTNADGTQTTVKVDYKGKSQSMFRIALGPDGKLYGSTAMPIHFIEADTTGDRWSELGQPGGGEFYSFLPYGDKLVCGAYSGNAPIMVYSPGKPWAPGTRASANPWLVHYDGENSGWRPMALARGANGKVYVGAVSGYGLLGGPLCEFDPSTGRVEQFLHLVPDQSVVALCPLPDGRIVGGTTVGGGGGSTPTQTEAKLFVWDPATRTKTIELVPAPGTGSVNALALDAAGRVHGFAGKTYFVFDLKTGKMVKQTAHKLGGVIYNAVALGPKEALYGLCRAGIFRIAKGRMEPKLVAKTPKPVDGGFAIANGRVYFTCGPTIMSWGVR